MKKFWTFRNAAEPDTEGRELTIDGEIAEESWWGDEITPAAFRGELFERDGPVTVWINSPGGDCFAASRIYTMIGEYRARSDRNVVTVRIDGLAASAASVIAMSGSRVEMAQTAMMMIHNPSTFAMGDHNEMEKAAEILNEVRESLVNAYERKTGLSRARIIHMMEAETWMNANRAVELGFADAVIGEADAGAQAGAGGAQDAQRLPGVSYAFERRTAEGAILNRLAAGSGAAAGRGSGRRVDDLMDALMMNA